MSALSEKEINKIKTAIKENMWMKYFMEDLYSRQKTVVKPFNQLTDNEQLILACDLVASGRLIVTKDTVKMIKLF